MNKLIEQLSHCQVIPLNSLLYKQVEKISEDDDWFTLTTELANRGYNIHYNNFDECYVIY